MDEFEMALVLKRAMQAYGGNINEYGGLGIFKDLLTGKAVMELKLEDGKLVFTQYTAPPTLTPVEPTTQYHLYHSKVEKT